MPMATAMLALPQVSLVGTMMIPTVAANNAAAAANNVNANLNSVILQLSNTVGTVIRLMIQLLSEWQRWMPFLAMLSTLVRQHCASEALTLTGRRRGLFLSWGALSDETITQAVPCFFKL